MNTDEFVSLLVICVNAASCDAHGRPTLISTRLEGLAKPTMNDTCGR